MLERKDSVDFLCQILNPDVGYVITVDDDVRVSRLPTPKNIYPPTFKLLMVGDNNKRESKTQTSVKITNLTSSEYAQCSKMLNSPLKPFRSYCVCHC